MIKTAGGEFSINIYKETGKYRYRFLADGEVKLDDRIKVRIETDEKGEKYNYIILEKKSYQKYRGKSKKTVRKTIMKVLKINKLDRNIIFERTLWCILMHVANPS